MTNKRDKDIDALDNLYQALAEDDADNADNGGEVDEEMLVKQQQRATARINAARRAHIEKVGADAESIEPPSIPARILSMTREAILARLEALQQQFPGQLAMEHRKLDELPLGDLQSLLADVERITTHEGDDDAR